MADSRQCSTCQSIRVTHYAVMPGGAKFYLCKDHMWAALIASIKYPDWKPIKIEEPSDDAP